MCSIKMSIVIHMARPSAYYYPKVVMYRVRRCYPSYTIAFCSCGNHNPYLKPVVVYKTRQRETIQNVTFKKHRFNINPETFSPPVYCNICLEKTEKGYTCVETTHRDIHAGRLYSGFHVCEKCKVCIDQRLVPIVQGVPVS